MFELLKTTKLFPTLAEPFSFPPAGYKRFHFSQEEIQTLMRLLDMDAQGTIIPGPRKVGRAGGIEGF